MITGGIAAYKSLSLLRKLVVNGIRVQAVLSKHAEHFVTPLSVSTLTEREVIRADSFYENHGSIAHLKPLAQADLVVVAPATAHCLAELAQGSCSDYIATLLVASKCPIVLAPAMNPGMWENPAVKRNVAILQRDGILIIGPEYGRMAEREIGFGRMTEPDVLYEQIYRLLYRGANAQAETLDLLKGKRILITAGATCEYFDSIRYLTNASSGKQGFAIARRASELGARVTVIAGSLCREEAPLAEVIRVVSAEDMASTVEDQLGEVDLFLGVAAVSNWRSETIAPDKESAQGMNRLDLHLVKTRDILHEVATRHEKRPKRVGGFCAESGLTKAKMVNKLKRKGCDFLVGNDITRDKVFGSDENRVELLTKDGHYEQWDMLSKERVAEKLLHFIFTGFKQFS